MLKRRPLKYADLERADKSVLKLFLCLGESLTCSRRITLELFLIGSVAVPTVQDSLLHTT